MMATLTNKSVGRCAIWFFRVLGPALLASLLVQWLAGSRSGDLFQYVAGLVYLVAWVGSYLAFLEYGRARRAFALPFSLIAIAIVLLAGAALAPALREALPTGAQGYFGDAARIVHGMAALTIAVIGWTTPVTQRA